MVRIVALLLLLLPMATFAQRGVDVIVEVNSATAGENQPIDVDIKIVRDENLTVNESSFELEGKPLKVEQAQTSRQSSVTIINGRREEESLIITTYRTTIPGKPKGLYILPSISVEVSGNRYESKPVSYEIIASQESAGFRLSGFVEGITPLYPGQRAKFVYRIYFKDNIEVTYEDLPLMEAEGFRTVGQKQFRRFNRGDQQVTEVTQEVEAVAPGDYTFGPATIEGFSYRENFFGRKVYTKPRLRAISDPVKVTVAAFPSQGKPESFKGMIGDYQVEARLLTTDKVIVGDKVEVEVVFTGTGEMSSVQLPDLAKQEGFRGNFRFSDLPPVASEKSTTQKSFVVELRPITALVEEIPPIEVAQFNPITKKYEILKTDPISLEVDTARRPTKFEAMPPPPRTLEGEEDTPQPPKEPLQPWQGSIAIEISGNYALSSADLERPLYSRWLMLWLLPTGLLLLWVQWSVKRWKEKNGAREEKIPAKYLLDSGGRELSESEEGLSLITQGLLRRLHEVGILEEEPFSAEELPKEGICDEVRKFVQFLEECRFGGPSQYDASEIQTKARDLFRRIK